MTNASQFQPRKNVRTYLAPREYVGTYGLNESNDRRMTQMQMNEILERRGAVYQLCRRLAREKSQRHGGTIKARFNEIISMHLDYIGGMVGMAAE